MPSVLTTSSQKPTKIKAAHGSDFRADLLAVERDFITRFTQSGTTAYASTLSSEARLYRPGQPPACSSLEISNLFKTQLDGARVYELIDGEAASTGDLGYVYGWITTEISAEGKITTKRSNYLRIWKREDGRNWKIALDVIGAN
jgi:ketosteroid isomerase-like protein